eukprot:338088-Rhodomonas_salina.1
MTSERCGQNQYVVSGEALLCRECPTGLVPPSNCPTAHVCPADARDPNPGPAVVSGQTVTGRAPTGA